MFYWFRWHFVCIVQFVNQRKYCWLGSLLIPHRETGGIIWMPFVRPSVHLSVCLSAFPFVWLDRMFAPEFRVLSISYTFFKRLMNHSSNSDKICFKWHLHLFMLYRIIYIIYNIYMRQPTFLNRICEESMQPCANCFKLSKIYPSDTFCNHLVTSGSRGAHPARPPNGRGPMIFLCPER